jgi:hypothetical protein
LWGCWELPCTVHGTGPCPYPVAKWQPVFSLVGDGEGEEEVIEEDEAVGEEDDMVVVVVVDKDDELVEVIPVPESTPPRSLYKQTTQIWIGPWVNPLEP